MQERKQRREKEPLMEFSEMLPGRHNKRVHEQRIAFTTSNVMPSGRAILYYGFVFPLFVWVPSYIKAHL